MKKSLLSAFDNADPSVIHYLHAFDFLCVKNGKIYLIDSKAGRSRWTNNQKRVLKELKEKNVPIVVYRLNLTIDYVPLKIKHKRKIMYPELVDAELKRYY